MKNDDKPLPSSSSSSTRTTTMTTRFDEKKRAVTTTLTQIKENLRDRARLEELAKALLQEKDALVQHLAPSQSDGQAAAALSDFQRDVDALAAFFSEDKLGHLGKKTDKAITQHVQNVELSLGKLEAAPSEAHEAVQKQPHLKTPTSQARRSCVVIGSVGKRSVTNTPSTSRSISGSDSGSESADHDATPSAKKKAKKKKKASGAEHPSSPFAISMALPGISTESKLKHKRSLCLTGYSVGLGAQMRRRSTLGGKYSQGEHSAEDAAAEKETVQKECEAILKHIGTLEKICLPKKRDGESDSFDKAIQDISDSYEKLCGVAKNYKIGFKLGEFNEKRLKFVNVANSLYGTPGDSDLKTAFKKADNEFISYVLTYTEELLAQIERDEAGAREKFSSCHSSCTDDWGEQSEADYNLLAADNETLNDELAAREETIQRLTERVSALERSNKERTQEVQRLTQDNLLLTEQRIAALEAGGDGAQAVAAALRGEAEILARNNAELLKTIDAMKAEEARLERLLAAQEEQRVALEAQCDRIYSASQKLCLEQQQQQSSQLLQKGNEAGGGKPFRQRKAMSMCTDDGAPESPYICRPAAAPGSGVVNVVLGRRGNDGCDPATRQLVSLLGAVVPGFEGEWARLGKDKVRAVDRAVRALVRGGGAGAGGSVAAAQRAIRECPEALWNWERTRYAADLSCKLAQRKAPVSMREVSRRNELAGISADLAARVSKVVGAVSLVLTAQCAATATANNAYGGGADAQAQASRRRKTMSDIWDTPESGTPDAAAATSDPSSAYFARDEIDSDFVAIRCGICDLIGRVKEFTKELGSDGGDSDEKGNAAAAAAAATGPKYGRVCNQIESEIRCVCVKGTADSALVARAAAGGRAGRLAVCAQLAKGLEKDGESAAACVARVLAIVSAGYRYIKNFNSDAYMVMLWELSTITLRLARVLLRMSNCYETARLVVAAQPSLPLGPPEALLDAAAAATPNTGLWDELLRPKDGNGTKNSSKDNSSSDDNNSTSSSSRAEDDSSVTLNRLVELMTPVTAIRHKHDMNVVCGALGTLHTYTAPGELLAKLLERHNVPANALSAKHRAQVQQNVLCVLRTWAVTFGAVEDLAAAGSAQALLRFLEGLPPDTPVPAPIYAPGAAATTAQQFRREVRHTLALLSRRERALAGPHARIPIFREVISPLELIFVSSPTFVAEQLTLVTHSKVAAVRPAELASLIGSGGGGDPAALSNAAVALAERAAQVRQLVGIAVLTNSSAEQRALTLFRFAKVMVRLHELRNYSDLMSIYLGFKSAYIMQLERTMRLVNPETNAIIAKFDKLLSPDGEFKEYKRELEKAMNDNKPFIPAFDVISREIAALDDGSKKSAGPSVERCEEFWYCVAPLVKCQGRHYTIMVLEPLCSAVDELPVCTEVTLFNLSSTYEPRKHVGYLGKK